MTWLARLIVRWLLPEIDRQMTFTFTMEDTDEE